MQVLSQLARTQYPGDKKPSEQDDAVQVYSGVPMLAHDSPEGNKDEQFPRLDAPGTNTDASQGAKQFPGRNLPLKHDEAVQVYPGLAVLVHDRKER